MSLPRISFVVPLYNHLADTQAMLSSLLASLPEGLAFEVVLVDDHSSDGTREWLAALAGQGDDRIRILLNPENRGFARSCNAGAALARGELLGLLNNDLLFAPGWLEPMLAILEAGALNAGLVGNVQFRVADGVLDHAGVFLNPRGQFEHLQTMPASGAAGAPRSLQGTAAGASGTGSVRASSMTTGAAGGGVGPVRSIATRALAVTGACLLLRKADFIALGGFDEAYVNGCEDIDLCYKVRAAGRTIQVATTSHIRHHVSLSRDRNSVQNERNSRHLFARWRTEIKRDLTQVWAARLQSGPSACAPYVHGELDAGFVAMPQLAARTIAEAMLLREEFRWARELGDSDPNADLATRCQARGLRYLARFNCHLVTGKVELTVPGLRSTRNFYVCGRKIDPSDPRPLAVTLSANRIQHQTLALTDPHINAGLIEPVLLPDIDTVFEARFHYLDPITHTPTDDASHAVVLTHVVIDDKRIDRFG